jgi:hypothetical protein
LNSNPNIEQLFVYNPSDGKGNEINQDKEEELDYFSSSNHVLTFLEYYHFLVVGKGEVSHGNNYNLFFKADKIITNKYSKD